MPAAAVIPAPIAYIKVVAVKKLVVGFRGPRRCRPSLSSGIWLALSVSESDRSVERRALTDGPHLSLEISCLLLIVVDGEFGTFTLNKLECSKQAGCFEYVSME